MGMEGFPADKKSNFFQAPIKLAQPFPAPESGIAKPPVKTRSLVTGALLF